MNWKALLFLLSLFLLVVVAGWLMNHIQVRSANNGALDPADSTKSLGMDTFNKPVVLAPGQGVAWQELPQGSRYFPVISLEAKFPVTVYFIPEENVDLMNQRSINGLAMHTCEQEHKRKTVVSCDLDTSKRGYVFYIHDDRQIEENIPSDASQRAANEIHLTYRSVWRRFVPKE